MATDEVNQSVNEISAHQVAAKAADDKKALDVLVLDLREITSLTDYFVIATGTSDRHVRTIAEEIEAKLKVFGYKVLSQEGFDDATWVLLDYGDIVVHVFLSETRDFYNIERLWMDANRVDWESRGPSNLVSSDISSN
ncbi:MAG: ribosome silencing factor [Acidimicrobiales bacterium]|nr:ribosome silencing factor [Acidimicrobiales bacterium]